MADPLAFTPIPSGNLAPEREATPGFTPIPPAAAAPAAEPHAGPLSNKPDDSYAMGMLKNAIMIGLEVPGGVPGAVGNIREFAQFAADRARAYLTGKTMPEVVKKREADDLKERAEQAAWFQKTYGRPMPKLRKSLIEQAPTTEQAISPVTHFTGEYTPTSPEGRYGRTAGVVGLSMLLPGGLGAAARNGRTAGVVGLPMLLPGVQGAWAARKLASASPALVEPAMSAAAKLRTGAGLGVAQEAATDATGDPLVGAAVIPTIQGGKAVWKSATNVNPQARKLAERDAVDIDKVRKSLEDPSTYELVPGSKPTTAQLTQDEGLKTAQQKAILDRHFKEDHNALLLEQNEARRNHLQGQIPADADVLAAPKLLEAEQQGLQRHSDALHGTIPSNPTIVPESGATLAQVGRAGNREMSRRVSAIYDAMDPDKRISAPQPAHRAAAQPYHEAMTDPVKTLEVPDLVQQVLKMAETHPEQMSFDRLREFDRTLTSKIAQSTSADEKRILGELKTGLAHDIDNMHQNGATLAPPQAGTHVQGALTDAEYMARTAQQLQEAKALRTEQGTLYGRDPVASAIEHGGYGGPQPAGTTGKAAFPGGDNGEAATKAWIAASRGDPTAIAALQDIAMGRLREGMKRPDGASEKMLTQAQLEAWRDKYATSLKAIDEVAPGFSRRFDDVATATRTLDDFNHGLAGTIAKANIPSNPGAMQHIMGSIINSADGAAQLESILPRLGPKEIDGMRRSAVDYLFDSKFMNGKGQIQADAFIKHVRAKKDVLQKLYGDHFDNFQAVAEDLVRLKKTEQQLSITGSNTADKLQLVKGRDPQGHPLTAGGLLAIGSLLHHGGPELTTGAGALLGGWKGYQFLKNWKSTRAEQVYKHALMHPAEMRKLLQPGMLPNGRPNIPALNAVIAMGEGVHEHQRRDEQKRQGRASGGSVGTVDHARHASRMVRMVSKVRDELGRETKPLLNVHDNAIASALANARSMAS